MAEDARPPRVLLVAPDDPRIGVEWCTYDQLANRRGQSKRVMAVLISQRRIRAIARVDAKGRAALFDVQELTSAGIWPLHAFDPQAEVWLADYARARGLDPVHIGEQIRRELAAGGSTPPRCWSRAETLASSTPLLPCRGGGTGGWGAHRLA